MTALNTVETAAQLARCLCCFFLMKYSVLLSGHLEKEQSPKRTEREQRHEKEKALHSLFPK